MLVVNPFRAISISLSPNFGREEVSLCWKIIRGKIEVKGVADKLTDELTSYFGKEVVITENGRTGLYLLLKVWGVGVGDEVVVQAFTCSVVPMAIKALGAVPIYVDVDGDYNLDLEKLKNKISSKTKAVIVQHTFGKPVMMDKLKKIVPKRIKLIEDLAHGLGNKYQGVNLGGWSDGAVLSFGRDKVISGVSGGAVVAREVDIKKIRQLMNEWPVRDELWLKKQLWYPIWSWLVVNSYDLLGVGKWLHWILRRIRWLPLVIDEGEKKARMGQLYRGLPDQLAYLVWFQWQKIDLILERRQEIARIYADYLNRSYDADSSYLRYTLLVDDPVGLRKMATQKSIFLGDWYDQVIAPKSICLNDFDYVAGMSPVAEGYSTKVINLPTNYNLTQEEIEKIIFIVKKWKLKK